MTTLQDKLSPCNFGRGHSALHNLALKKEGMKAHWWAWFIHFYVCLLEGGEKTTRSQEVLFFWKYLHFGAWTFGNTVCKCTDNINLCILVPKNNILTKKLKTYTVYAFAFCIKILSTLQNVNIFQKNGPHSSFTSPQKQVLIISLCLKLLITKSWYLLTTKAYHSNFLSLWPYKRRGGWVQKEAFMA